MRTTILVLIAIVLLGSSCNKESCYQCTGNYNGNDMNNRICGQTKDEIRHLEGEGVFKCKKTK